MKNRENYSRVQSRNCAGYGCPGEIPIIRYDRPKPDDLPILRIVWVGDGCLLLCPDCRQRQRLHDQRRARRPGGTP